MNYYICNKILEIVVDFLNQNYMDVKYSGHL